MRLRNAVLLVRALAAACRSGPAPLRLGTTYTVQQSGALAVLESLWTGPPPFTTVVAPSGQILRAAANGDLDVVITHAPALEQRLLVAPGHALLHCRSEEHTSELQSRPHLVCRLLLEKKKVARLLD